MAWIKVTKEQFRHGFKFENFTVGATITECSNDYAMTEFIPKGSEEATHKTEHNNGLFNDPDYFIKPPTPQGE